MRALSLFSGAGGMDLGLERAGVRTVAFCEVDPHARRVLAHHWPDTPTFPEVTTLDPKDVPDGIDLVHGGSPCQDLSVAGARAGLDGARSGLFWHQCRIVDQVAARWFLWENVPGVLSSGDGADFAAVLWGITGTYPRVPDGGWRSCGVAVGPKRWCVWRVLDAQWFGVAQRRRRVFVVGGARCEPAPEVLLESESVPGDARPCREAGQVVAALTRNGVGGGGGLDDNAAQANHLIPAFAGRATSSWAKGPGNTQAESGALVAFHKTHRATSETDHEIWAPAEIAATLDAGGSNNHTAVLDHIEVRRLTPVECCRLMGWPDTWLDTDPPLADSHKYRLIGNGVAAPVATWIAHRLKAAT